MSFDPYFFLFFSFDILHEVIVQPNKVFDLKADVTMRLEAFALVYFLQLLNAEKSLVRLKESY